MFYCGVKMLDIEYKFDKITGEIENAESGYTLKIAKVVTYKKKWNGLYLVRVDACLIGKGEYISPTFVVATVSGF